MSDIRGLRVACLMMQRDEVDLLRPWVMYHAALFGIENLFVFDNGSTAASVTMDLVEFARNGANVDWKHASPDDFHSKGDILGSLILSLAGRYDFFLPLDCDEFFVVRTGAKKIACDPATIHADLAQFAGESRALQLKAAFYNVLNTPNAFWCWPHQKTFFSGNSFRSLDHGYHEGRTKAGGTLETDFAHIHYHHKPYALMVEHAKNKLRPYVAVEDRSALEDYVGMNYHCKTVLLQGAEAYNSQFTMPSDIRIPEFAEYLRALGAPVPYA